MTGTYSMMIDARTGAITFRGSDGKTYTDKELATAERDAARGDAAAQATLAAIRRPAPTSRAEAQRMLEADMDDCPLCREARAHGEAPIMVSNEDVSEVQAWMSRAGRDAPRPPNWWHGRRPKKRGRR